MPPGDLPRAIPGFEKISRYWDRQQGLYAAKIIPGEYYVTTHPDEMVVTVLGSCVSACIRDTKLKIGGMNHFMLPQKAGIAADVMDGNAEKYGLFAMESLINQILGRGGLRRNLEVKVTGGGKVLAMKSDVGDKNIDFVRKFIREEEIRLVAEDLGGTCARKVYYLPSTGRMRVKKLQDITNATISERESTYAETLVKKAEDSLVELF